MLDPATVVRFAEDRLRPTVYVAERLIMSTRSPLAFGILRDAAHELGMDAVPEPLPNHEVLSQPVRLVPLDDNVPVDIDAWAVLQRARGRARSGPVPVSLAGVGLDHVLFPHGPANSATLIAVPYEEPHKPVGNALSGLRGRDGYAGPYPVAMLAAAPIRDGSLKDELRPVIAVVDTGCGAHPWLTGLQGTVLPEIVISNAHGSEDGEWPTENLDGMRPFAAGHGTFIAGLIRQRCPDAKVLPIRLLAPDGTATEADLNMALQWILDNSTTNGGTQRVDVVSLSFGYHHEQDDQPDDSVLASLLAQLGQAGIVVVASAGNDASTRPVFPAAFAPKPGAVDTSGPVPLISVGALNPDGSIALFSNNGDWVRAWEQGVSLVSTMPAMNYGEQPVVVRPRAVEPSDQRDRRAFDPDGFGVPRVDGSGVPVPDDSDTGEPAFGGFAQWSGTSFSAPLLAANIAQKLVGTTKDPAKPTADAWGAITNAVPSFQS